MERLGRVLTLLVTKELEKRAVAQALAQRVEELSTIAEIVHELAAARLDIERITDLMLDRAIQATGADYGALALHDKETCCAHHPGRRGGRSPQSGELGEDQRIQ